MGTASSPRNRQMIRCLRQVDVISLQQTGFTGIVSDRFAADDPIFSDCMRASQNVQHVPNSYEGTTVATQEMQNLYSRSRIGRDVRSSFPDDMTRSMKSGIVISGAEFSVAHNGGVKRHGGLDAGDVILVERASHAVDGIDPRRAHRDDFCDQ